MRRSIGGTVGIVFVASFLLTTREFSFLAAGLLQDGIEHLHHEALFRARQLADPLHLLLELGRRSALGGSGGVCAQRLDRGGQRDGQRGQHGDGDTEATDFVVCERLLRDPEDIGELLLREIVLFA